MNSSGEVRFQAECSDGFVFTVHRGRDLGVARFSNPEVDSEFVSTLAPPQVIYRGVCQDGGELIVSKPSCLTSLPEGSLVGVLPAVRSESSRSLCMQKEAALVLYLR